MKRRSANAASAREAKRAASASTDLALLAKGLSPEPGKTPILDLEPVKGRLSGSPPPFDYADGRVMTQWLHACPIPYPGERLCVKLARGLSSHAFAHEIEPILLQMKPLPADLIVPESYPDFAPAIDLRRLAGGADEVLALFYAELRNDRERIVRVSHGAAGEGVVARLLIGRVSVPHGGFVRLRPGRYAVVMETFSGKTEYKWQWPERRVGPRFDEVSRADLAAVDRWRHDVWARSRDAAGADETSTVRGIQIEPGTIVGRKGFIRVGRSANGFWWLLRPDGTPFYYRAMCSVNNRGSYGGRRKGDPALAPEMVRHSLSVIRSWGFNGLGSWTTREFFDQGLTFTEIIESFYEGPYVQGGEYRYGVMPDVFDPEWARRIDAKCRELCAPLARSRQLLGYFIDNERGFHQTRRPEDVVGPVYRVGDVQEKRRVIVAAEPIQNPEKLGLLQLVLSIDPAVPAARQGWAFVERRYGAELATLARSWGVPLTSRLSFNEMTINGERLVSDAYLRDEELFIREWIRQYFKVCVGAIRRHDPNHLVLGLRWAGLPDPLVFEEERSWSDIVSINRYRAEMVEAFEPIYRIVNKPILIGEFQPDNDSYRYVHDPVEPPGGYESDDVRQARRAIASNDRVAAHPGIVGWTYYAWKAGTGHPDTVRPMVQSNWRALPIRVACDAAAGRPKATRFAPLHGQIHLTVGNRKGMVSLGFLCRKGKWDRAVRGNGIRGEVIRWQDEGCRIRLEIRFTLGQGMFALQEGEGRYSVDLERISQTDLAGTSRGGMDGAVEDGMAMGFVSRPIPNPLL